MKNLSALAGELDRLACALARPLNELPLPPAAVRVARRLGWRTVAEFIACPQEALRALGVGPASLEEVRCAFAAIGVVPDWRTRPAGRRKRTRRVPGPPPNWQRIRAVVVRSAHARPLATLTNEVGRPLLPRAVRALARYGILTIGDLMAQTPEALRAIVSRNSLTRLATALREVDAIPSSPVSLPDDRGRPQRSDLRAKFDFRVD